MGCLPMRKFAVNQQGYNPRQLYKANGSMIWISDAPGTGDKYVALFNISDTVHQLNRFYRGRFKRKDSGQGLVE